MTTDDVPEYADDPAVADGELAVRAAGALTAEGAAHLLAMWERYGELSDGQRRAVVARFER